MKGNPEKRKTHEKLYKYYKTPRVWDVPCHITLPNA